MCRTSSLSFISASYALRCAENNCKKPQHVNLPAKNLCRAQVTTKAANPLVKCNMMWLETTLTGPGFTEVSLHPHL